MPFKTGLIIYRHQRFNEVYQTSIKYGLSLRKLNYSKSKDSHKKPISVASIKGIRQIRELTYRSSTNLQDNHFVSLISKIGTLQALSIDLSSRESLVFREVKAIIRKIFSRIKRVVDLRVCFPGQDEGKRIFLEPISWLRSLQHLKLNLNYKNDYALETLAAFFQVIYRRKSWPLLKWQEMELNLGPEVAEEVVSNNLISLSKLLNHIVQEKNSEMLDIKLHLPLTRHPNVPAFAKLAEDLKNLSHLKKLALESDCDLNGFCLIKAIQDNPFLRHLALNLSQQQADKVFFIIPECLTSLNIKITSYNKPQCMNQFAQRLSSLSQLTTLALSLRRVTNLDDEFLILLAKSFSNLPNLRQFELNLKYQEMAKLLITGVGFKHLCQAIGQLTSLRELKLEFKNFGRVFSNDVLINLSDSLQKLNRLSSLKLTLNSNRIGSEGLMRLAKVLPTLGFLETFEVSLKRCDLVNLHTLTTFAHNLGCLKAVSSLTLNLVCLKIDFMLFSAFVSTIHKLKSLDYLKLKLQRPVKEEVSEAYMQNIMERFQGRMKVIYKVLDYSDIV